MTTGNPSRTDIRAVNFAVCNFGAAMFEEPETQYPTTKIRSLNSSPSSKARLPCAFSNMMIGKKLPTAHVRASKEHKHMKKSPEGRDHNQHADNGNMNPILEFDVTKGLKRFSLESKEYKSVSSSRNLPNVKVVSLNDQAVMRKQTPEPIGEHFDAKQNKKYAHFRKTQNTTFTQYFGKIKNIIASKNKMTNSAVQLDKPKSQYETDSPLPKGSHKEKEKLPFVEAKNKESILIKKQILEDPRSPFADERLRGRDILRKTSSIDPQGRDKTSKSPVLAATAMQWQQFLETTPLDTSTERDLPYLTNNFDSKDKISQLDAGNLPNINKTSTKKFYMVEHDKTMSLLSHRRVFSLFDGNGNSPKKNTEAKVHHEKVLQRETKIKKDNEHMVQINATQTNFKHKQRQEMLNRLTDESREFQRGVKTLETEESQPPILPTFSPSKVKNSISLRKMTHTRWKTITEKPVIQNTSPLRASNNNGVNHLSKSNGKMSPLLKHVKQIENIKNNSTEEDANDFSIEGWESEPKGYN